MVARTLPFLENPDPSLEKSRRCLLYWGYESLILCALSCLEVLSVTLGFYHLQPYYWYDYDNYKSVKKYVQKSKSQCWFFISDHADNSRGTARTTTRFKNLDLDFSNKHFSFVSFYFWWGLKNSLMFPI